ncbi:uncharacterized protein [Palaemon carinicauda]|uniref:uncharacterized protein isoform X1 n=1 Tax=Palaemon carinicauda TaxID=392227 RepID=UPI0035B6A6E5
MEEEESLDCPVCFERYDNNVHTPKIMPCLHTICVSCTLEVITGNERQTTVEAQPVECKEPTIPSGKRFLCPFCREHISSDRLQTNRYILAHLQDLNRLTSQNHVSLEHKGEDSSLYQHSKITMTSKIPTDFHETQVESDKTKLILLSRLRRLIKHERAPSPPSEFVVSTSVSGLQEDTRESNQAASSLQFTSQSQPSSSNVQFTPVSYPSDGTPEVSGGRFRGFVKRKGKHSHELKVGVTSSRTFQTSTQNTPTTPVAGHPLIYPKLPPATTLHQQSPSHLKYATKLIRKDTPTISEEDFIEISDNSYHILFNNSAEGNVNQNPTAPTYMDDMWCRTCEEPGKIQCIGHDVISILKDDEVNWIQTQLRGQDKVVGQDRNTDLSAAMSRASIASSTEYDDFNRTRVDNRKTPSEVLNMSRWSYAEIRDTVNTSCQPEVVMECYKELDRRHIEYQMTHNRKKPLNFFHKHK